MTTDTPGSRPRGSRRRMRGAAVPLGTLALLGVHAALATRGHLLPPPAGPGQVRVARPREVVALGRAAAGRGGRRPVRRGP
ncbi:hypothetical protein ACWFR5_29220 [Streptomyces sp. NPDC055092]